MSGFWLKIASTYYLSDLAIPTPRGNLHSQASGTDQFENLLALVPPPEQVKEEESSFRS